MQVAVKSNLKALPLAQHARAKLHASATWILPVGKCFFCTLILAGHTLWHESLNCWIFIISMPYTPSNQSRSKRKKSYLQAAPAGRVEHLLRCWRDWRIFRPIFQGLVTPWTPYYFVKPGKELQLLSTDWFTTSSSQKADSLLRWALPHCRATPTKYFGAYNSKFCDWVTSGHTWILSLSFRELSN